MAKSLLAAIADGVRPLRASLNDEQLKELRLKDAAGWPTWYSPNYSGQNVTVNSVLQLSTAWACVRLISETASTLPCGVFKARADGSKELAPLENLYALLHSQPNADMTATTFWQAFFASLLLWGNTYVEIRRSADTVTSLEFLLPQFITWYRNTSGAIEWKYNDPITGKTRDIPDSRMWHTPAFSIDGIWGLSPIRYGANVFGNAMAANQSSGETFKNGMKSPGLVTMDVILKKDQREEIRGHVRDVAASGGWMVLEKGADLKQLAMNPQDAELLMTLGFGVEEICRWFGVPPFMVGHSEKSTSWGTGIEQQMIGFVTFVMRPWCVRVEQSIRKALIPVAQRGIISAEFALEGLLRGDSAARAAFYSVMTDKGIFSRDDCRHLENRPAMGGNAAVLTVQSQMVPLDSIGQATGTDANTARDALMAWLSAGNPAKE